MESKTFTVRIDNRYCNERCHPRCKHYMMPLKDFIEFEVTFEQFRIWLNSERRNSDAEILMTIIDCFGNNGSYHPDPKIWWGPHYDQKHVDSMKINRIPW